MEKRSDFLRRFEKELDGCIKDGEECSVLVALSGGADSVVLLRLLKMLSINRPLHLEAFHLNHLIRAEEAMRDERFCASLCKELQVPFHSARADIPALSKERQQGMEECAREERYRFLKQVSDVQGLSLIATAHNADDQLETMLFRLARGCALRGLCGIPQRRGKVIRPLLAFSGKEIRDLASREGWAYREDCTNFQELYARNRIRHRALPVLEELHRGSALRACATARQLLRDEEYLCSLVPTGKLGAKELKELPLPILYRYLRARFEEYSATRQCAVQNTAQIASQDTVQPPLKMPEEQHLDALAELVALQKIGKPLSLPGMVRATLYEDGLVFSPDRQEEEGYERSLSQGVFEIPSRGLRLFVMKSEQFDEFWVKTRKIHNLFMKASINSATIEGSLYIRNVKKGDRIKIGGMTRRLVTLMGARKVPLEVRNSYPVFCDGEGPLWLPGDLPRDGCTAGACDLILAIEFVKEQLENT